MLSLLNGLLFLLWIIDIFNFTITFQGVTYITPELLDIEIPINFWVWFLIWCFMPSSSKN